MKSQDLPAPHNMSKLFHDKSKCILVKKGWGQIDLKNLLLFYIFPYRNSIDTIQVLCGQWFQPPFLFYFSSSLWHIEETTWVVTNQSHRSHRWGVIDWNRSKKKVSLSGSVTCQYWYWWHNYRLSSKNHTKSHQISAVTIPCIMMLKILYYAHRKGSHPWTCKGLRESWLPPTCCQLLHWVSPCKGALPQL